jgi:hypothetical protein
MPNSLEKRITELEIKVKELSKSSIVGCSNCNGRGWVQYDPRSCGSVGGPCECQWCDGRGWVKA